VSVHLQRQFDRVKKSILSLSAMVEESVLKAIQAAETNDSKLAAEVSDADERIDLMEIDVEEECLHTLALHQPVAFDLRFIVATLKINNDLERIGDLCVNIADQIQMLADGSMPTTKPLDMRQMGRCVRQMLKNALDALVNVDPDLAEQVIRADEQVDAMHRETYRQVEQLIRQDPDQTGSMIHFLGISRQFERMGDHCVNIAEDVLYMAKGGIARHQPPGA
jgi:phosphate transport system protein